MSADSPIVWVRKNALFTLREWIDDQGIPISRKDDMRNMLDLMEKREKLLLSSTYGDCTISRHASRVSLKHIEWIRNALNGIPNVENRKVYTR